MSVILVVGSPGSGKRTLVQALVHSLRKGNADQQELGSQATVTADRQVLLEQAATRFDVYPASITTKYYNAQVSFWRQAQASVPVLALRSAEQLTRLEGIIVVFDLLQESSLEEVAQWAAFVDDKEQCAFRVCVGSKLDLLPVDGADTCQASATQPEPAVAAEREGAEVEGNADAAAEGLRERRGRCLEWCLDHGFEYVEANCRDCHRGGELREKEGVPRILEALQSNVWTGMEFCTDSRPSLMAAAVASSGGGGAGGGNGNVGGMGSVSESSDSEDGTAALSRSVEENGEQEESEYLSGFVDGNDSGGEYAGYGALDSGSEENDDEGEQVGGGSAGGKSDGVDNGGRDETWALRGEGPVQQGGGKGDGVGVGPSHIELQERWEQGNPSCPLPAPAGPTNTPPPEDEATLVDDKGATVASKSDRETASAHEGMKESGKAVTPDDKPPPVSASASSNGTMPGEGSVGPDGDDDGDGDSGGGGEGHAVTAEEGGGQGRRDADSKRFEEYLLEAAGSMVGGRGVDFEETEMEQLMGEVRKARELGSSVSDAERRSRAANVAMRLAALLGDFGDDSGDSGDDER